MRNTPRHTANGCHLLVIFELSQQSGFCRAVAINLPARLFYAVEHMIQACRQCGYFGWPFPRGTVRVIALRHLLHVRQQFVHVSADATIVTKHDGADNGQAQQAPCCPGNNSELVQGAAKIAGAPSDLNQTLNIAAHIKQWHEVRKQMSAPDLAKALLGLSGSDNKVRDLGSREVAFGDTGRGQPHAVDIEH